MDQIEEREVAYLRYSSILFYILLEAVWNKLFVF